MTVRRITRQGSGGGQYADSIGFCNSILGDRVLQGPADDLIGIVHRFMSLIQPRWRRDRVAISLVAGIEARIDINSTKHPKSLSIVTVEVRSVREVRLLEEAIRRHTGKDPQQHGTVNVYLVNV